jgi:integrase
MTTEFKPRGRPATARRAEYTCARCGRATGKIRVRWPDGHICGICFTNAVHSYGECALCGQHRMLPGVTESGEKTCRDCAGINTRLTCDKCGREAERYRGGHCITCVVAADLTELLKPNDPPDLRLRRLVKILSEVERPESIYTWLRTSNGRSAELLRRIGDREIELSHEAFDALPKTASVEHLRAILTHNRILPTQDDRQLAMFEQWLHERLEQLADSPEIQSPIERFGRWHHLRRLTMESHETKNMNYAVRSAKQEITEAGKFLRWISENHGRNAANFRQVHVDEYLAEGPSTRRHTRNFVRYLKRERTNAGVDVPIRLAKTTPMLSQDQRLAHVKTLMEAENLNVSLRVAGLIFLLFGYPIGKLCMLSVDDVDIRPTGVTIKLGTHPAPIPELLIPLFVAHMKNRDGQQTVNTGTRWLFPGNRAGRPRSPNTVLLALRRIGIDIQGVRNTTLQGLVRDMDATSLSRMLGYSKQTLSRHATAATAAWSYYVIDKNPRFAKKHPGLSGPSSFPEE